MQWSVVRTTNQSAKNVPAASIQDTTLTDVWSPSTTRDGVGLGRQDRGTNHVGSRHNLTPLALGDRLLETATFALGIFRAFLMRR